ncbi:MAG: Rieske 2Fe-2S family protein [Dokdonia sp.]|jgi:Rieske 2Fe-2S family protein
MNDFFEDITQEKREHTKTLPSNAYTNPEIFERERYTLFKYVPTLATPECLILKEGNYEITEIASESMIILRGKNEEISALANICRHRGKKLIKPDASKNIKKKLKSIVCPYHAWKYDLDGQLVVARGDQSRATYRNLCLRKLHIQNVAGLVFYHGNAKPLPQIDNLEVVLGSLNLRDAKVAERIKYPVKANWKIFTENFLECWHCATSHPELSEVKSFIQQFENGKEHEFLSDDVKWRTKARKKGWVPPQDIDFQTDEHLFHFNTSTPLGGGKATANKSGERMGEPLGKAAGLEGGAIFGSMGPFLFYLAYVDYVILFCIRPKSVSETVLEVFWLTSPSFETPIEDLTWLWNTTIQQDIALVEETYEGVTSMYYTPGPFQADEYRAKAFVNWWMDWESKTDKNNTN